MIPAPMMLFAMFINALPMPFRTPGRMIASMPRWSSSSSSAARTGPASIPSSNRSLCALSRRPELTLSSKSLFNESSSSTHRSPLETRSFALLTCELLSSSLRRPNPSPRSQPPRALLRPSGLRRASRHARGLIGLIGLLARPPRATRSAPSSHDFNSMVGVDSRSNRTRLLVRGVFGAPFEVGLVMDDWRR